MSLFLHVHAFPSLIYMYLSPYILSLSLSPSHFFCMFFLNTILYNPFPFTITSSHYPISTPPPLPHHWGWCPVPHSVPSVPLP